MIKLPDNWRSLVFVNTHTNALLLCLKNDDDQYFAAYHRLDKAFSLDEQLESFGNTDFSDRKVQKANRLTRVIEQVEPTNQEWSLVPIPIEGTVSLEQYRAMNRV